MQIPDILRNRWTQTTAISVVTGAAGVVLGYILAKRKYEMVVEVTQETTVEESVNVYTLPISSYTSVGPVTVVKEYDPELEKLLDEEEEIEKREQTQEVESIKVNVFTVEDSDWDQEAELATRDPNGPYIIHQEEFISDDMGYHQETLTYYQGDDIMADNEDTPIYNYAGLMGELRFGHGSKDRNVVYIRNEKLHIEWEILLHQGHFAQEVLGLRLTEEAEAEDDLRHSVQKFRQD